MADLHNDFTEIQINNDTNSNNQDTIEIKKTKESLKRTVVKAIFWRVIAILSTFMLGALLYNDLQKATYLAIIDNIIKFILHFIFELVFNKWKWGIIIE